MVQVKKTSSYTAHDKYLLDIGNHYDKVSISCGMLRKQLLAINSLLVEQELVLRDLKRIKSMEKN